MLQDKQREVEWGGGGGGGDSYWYLQDRERDRWIDREREWERWRDSERGGGEGGRGAER